MFFLFCLLFVCFFYWEQLLLLELMLIRLVRVNQNKLGTVKLK